MTIIFKINNRYSVYIIVITGFKIPQQTRLKFRSDPSCNFFLCHIFLQSYCLEIFAYFHFSLTLVALTVD